MTKSSSDEDFLKKSGKDMADDISSAIWNEAGKFYSKKEAKSVPKLTDKNIWEDQNVLVFKDFVTSPDHLNFPPLSERQLRASEYMFGDSPADMFTNGRNTACLIWGKGAGKDTISAMMILYVVYVLLNFKNPQRMMGLPDNDSLDILNLAASKEQAERVFYDKLKTLVMNWKWLKGRYDLQLSGRYFSSVKKDISQVDKRVVITNDAIIFPKRIRAFSGSSESESQEGDNLLMFVLDEADAFKTKSASRSAAKIYRMCRTSAFSRFKKNYKGFIISYPRSKDGFIMKMYEQTKRFLNVYGDIAATWEVKPRHLYSAEEFEFEGHRIPMDFYEEFRLDPVGAKRAYLCQAPASESAFFDDPDKIDDAAASASRREQAFEFRDVTKDGYIRKVVSKAPYMPDRTVRHVLCLDLGLKKDPTALALMHRDQDKIYVDSITDWIPDPKNKIVVDLQNVEDVILNMAQVVTVEHLYADHWQCLAGDTKVPLIDGSTKTMKELAAEHPDGGFWVYSIKNGRIVPAMASAARKTGDMADTLKITLDNGEAITATASHLFMRRDGEYVPASQLSAGDSLMPLYRRISKRPHQALTGYEMVLQPTGNWQFSHRMVMEGIDEPTYRRNSIKKMVVHHRDFDKRNNAPENLQWMNAGDHIAYHASLRERFEDVRIKAQNKFWADPVRTEARNKKASESIKKLWRENPEYAYKVLSSLHRAIEASRHVDQSGRRAALIKNIVQAGKRGNRKFTAEDRKKISSRFKKLWQDPEFRSKMSKRARGKNHKIVSIEPGPKVDVYDIEVPGTSNFAVDAGVFVHNSALVTQRMRARGLKSDTVMLSYDDYELFKRMLYAGSVVLPNHKRLLEEIKSLQLYSGKKVDHPEGGHNDLVVTVVMGVKMLIKAGKTASMSSNLAAEGEYVGESLHEAIDVPTSGTESKEWGIMIDGIQM